MKIERVGSLSVADSKHSIPVPFINDTDLEWIEIDFVFKPVRETDSEWSNQISFSLFDPYRYRGTRHNSLSQHTFISTDTASPGFLAGEIPAGEWLVYLDVHRIVGSVSFYQWLNDGNRIAMTAGSDIHDDPRKYADDSCSFGLNVVYAEAPTEQAILTAIAGGRSYLSCGPTLILTGSLGPEYEERYMPGDTMPGTNEMYLDVQTEATVHGDYVRIIQNGEEMSRRPITASDTWTIRTAAVYGSWYVAELRNHDEVLKAVTNALFVFDDYSG